MTTTVCPDGVVAASITMPVRVMFVSCIIENALFQELFRICIMLRASDQDQVEIVCADTVEIFHIVTEY